MPRASLHLQRRETEPPSRAAAASNQAILWIGAVVCWVDCLMAISAGICSKREGKLTVLYPPRGKAHELARQILKEGEPVCEHHVPHVSGGSTHELKTKTSLLRMRWVCLKPQQRHLQKRRRRKSPLAPHSRICMQPLEWPGQGSTSSRMCSNSRRSHNNNQC